MADKLEHISGTIEKVIYTNPENDYAVIQVIPDDAMLPIIATGTIPKPTVGQTIKLWGKWDQHPKYGKQFKVEDFKAFIPTGGDNSAMIKYLSSELIYGIGNIYADRIVQKFGDETMDVILNHPERLTEVEGIGKQRASKIHHTVKKAYTEQASLHKLAGFLFQHNFGQGMIKRIWRRYGENALRVVKNNPYLLAEEVWGIGFATADKLAQSQGIQPDDPRRIAAGILYVLQRASDDGHCYLPKDKVSEDASKILQADTEKVSEILHQCASVEKVISDDERIYLPRFYISEEEVSRLLADLLSVPPSKEIHYAMAESMFNLAQRDLQFTYTDEQREAIIGALSGKVIIITGGPGTGKTTIVQSILFGAKQLKWKVKLAAPTGRAAKRLSETTRYPASTIHRMLKYNPGMAKFEMDRNNPLKLDMLILDEVSMIDIELFWRVLIALPSDARLVLVGDADQLPSVGPGAVLKDMINSKKIPTVRLTQIMRQDEHGLIVRNAHRILRGKMPIIRNDARDDFFMLNKHNSQDAQDAVLELVCQRIPNNFGFEPTKDIQVITPMHKGKCGARELNILLRERLNPSPRDAKITNSDGKEYRLPFSPGDKVMQIANNYDLSVFNGEIGEILTVDESKRQMVIRFDIGDIIYDHSYWSQLTLAYAITVHKSQGSEYPAVVMPLLTEHYIMLARNLLYTAITRAQKLLIIVGSKKALGIAVGNNRTLMRYTALANRIAEKLNNYT